MLSVFVFTYLINASTELIVACDSDTIVVLHLCSNSPLYRFGGVINLLLLNSNNLFKEENILQDVSIVMIGITSILKTSGDDYGGLVGVEKYWNPDKVFVAIWNK